jgi:hypothetical protein
MQTVSLDMRPDRAGSGDSAAHPLGLSVITPVSELRAELPILSGMGLDDDTRAVPARERAAQKYRADDGDDNPMDQQARHGDNRGGDQCRSGAHEEQPDD